MDVAKLKSDLEAQLAAKDEVIARLTRRVEELTAQVAKLTAQLNKNSKNSSRPPSSDSPGARPKGGDGPVKQPISGQRGGRKGHVGAKRELVPPERVDESHDLFPTECASCAAKLLATGDARPSIYQTTEIPPVRPRVVEYRCHAVRCACGHKTRAVAPAHVTHSPFGPRLMSVVGLLTGVYHVSRRQTRAFLQDLLGIQISLGGLSRIEKRVGTALREPVEQVQATIDAAPVRHADGTSWLQCNTLRSLWTFATSSATSFVVLANGATETIRPYFGKAQGILVSDRATVFSFWPMRRRQICWAHLKRKFVSFSEQTGAAEKLGVNLLEYVSLVFRYWRDFRGGHLLRERFLSWMRPVQAQFEACLEQGTQIKAIAGSCKDMLKHREALWLFVTVPGVEPTNNHAERELRKFVLWRKSSFGSQSERGSVYAARVMTVAHTAKKQRKNIFTFLEACCRAQADKAAAPSLFSPGIVAAA